MPLASMNRWLVLDGGKREDGRISPTENEYNNETTQHENKQRMETTKI